MCQWCKRLLTSLIKQWGENHQLIKMVSERPEEIVQYKCYPSRRYQSAPNIIAYRRSRRKECTFAPNGIPILVGFLGFFIAFTSFLKICRRRPPGEESSGFAASINFSHPADPLQWVWNVWCPDQCHFPTTGPYDFGMFRIDHYTVCKPWIIWYRCQWSHQNAKALTWLVKVYGLKVTPNKCFIVVICISLISSETKWFISNQALNIPKLTSPNSPNSFPTQLPH